jgi:hypothetical protein
MIPFVPVEQTGREVLVGDIAPPLQTSLPVRRQLYEWAKLLGAQTIRS